MSILYSFIIPHSQSVGILEYPCPSVRSSVRSSVRPSPYLVYATTHLSFGGFCSYLVCWLGMMRGCAYYTDFTVGWFLAELWPFMVKIHFISCLSLCTQLLIYPFADFVHIWYVSWAWCEDAHIIPISRLVDFWRSYGPLWWKFILYLV